jgi:ABC-type lipoprotein release transport system permease subunit
VATQWLARFAETQLFDVQTKDPVTLAGAAITVLIAALAAAYVPARRVVRIDAIVVLRAE